MAYKTRNIPFEARLFALWLIGRGILHFTAVTRVRFPVWEKTIFYTTVYVAKLQEFLGKTPGGKGWNLDSFHFLAQY